MKTFHAMQPMLSDPDAIAAAPKPRIAPAAIVPIADAAGWRSFPWRCDGDVVPIGDPEDDEGYGDDEDDDEEDDEDDEEPWQVSALRRAMRPRAPITIALMRRAFVSAVR
jgi:hypothetical protein